MEWDPRRGFEIRDVARDRGPICESILRSLPAWFGIESSILAYARDVESRLMLGAYAGETCAGILALTRHNEFTAEIHVMAVRPEFHGRGAGKALLARAEETALDLGLEFLSVKTLAASHPSPEYARTREFYLGEGFRPIEVLPTLGSATGPCLLLVKPLSAGGHGH